MEFISADGNVASRAQIDAVFQPFQMPPAGASVRILVLDEFLKALGQ